MKIKSLEPTEDQQQIAFIQWFRLKYPKLTLYHVPNGELRHHGVGRKLKRMGVLPGVFDLHLLDYHLFIEFKRNAKGKLSNNQIDFEEKALGAGHQTMVVHGLDHAMASIDKFIEKVDMK